MSAVAGAVGGLYGGGGGCGAYGSVAAGPGGFGRQGIIVITYTPAFLGGVEQLANRNPQKRAWRARPELLREEFIRNPTQTAFKPWGFEEDPRVRRVPYR
ncbi:MAG TPA: hypothetical protein VGF36_01520, partial [Rhodopila sp.]